MTRRTATMLLRG